MANGRYLLDETGAILTLESGHDAGRGNLLGIQPWMTAADYGSQEAFHDKLAGYLKAARGKGWLNARTIVVWPEYVGTWLVIAGEGHGVARAATLTGAMVRLALRHSVKLVRFLFSARERDRVAASLFRMQADAAASAYQAGFSRLARTYGVTVVAGSTRAALTSGPRWLCRGGGWPSRGRFGRLRPGWARLSRPRAQGLSYRYGAPLPHTCQP